MGFLATVALVLSGCTATPTGAKVGDLAPAFTLTDSEGSEVTLDSFTGKPVVLFFVSMGGDCASCIAEQRNGLAPLAQDANGTVGFVTITHQFETNARIRWFKNQTGAAWPHARDTDDAVARYGVYYVSTVVALDAHHRVALHDVSPSPARIREAVGL